MKICPNCDKEITKRNNKFCNSICNIEYKQKLIFEKIENGDTTLYVKNYKNYFEEIEKLPQKHNARKDPNFVIGRWVVDKVELPPLTKLENRVDVIVFGEYPKLKSPVV